MSSSDDSCCWCCCCELLCKLVGLVVSIGITILIWWLIFQPRLPRAIVEEIRLSNFNLTDSSTVLRFNLTVRLALRNPNKRVRIYYDSLEAAVLYHGMHLQSTPLPPFFQHTKSTAALPAEFGGRAADAGPVAAFYGTEKSQGRYNFEVKLDARLRMKLGIIKIGHFKPKFDCKVEIAAPQGGGGLSVSMGTWACDR
ncbi:hypothetical protein Cni_G11032 [Canna indica]|uniref:Late embryogenesis abundant protein LEA-2 subgroup domain-containing protein n=1 Tax=Canna indica TaxID=4628 RepID=A0AAQ3K5B7_9LILI|nr:hypothetical protein Cni_G11032 [Canna indica]